MSYRARVLDNRANGFAPEHVAGFYSDNDRLGFSADREYRYVVITYADQFAPAGR